MGYYLENISSLERKDLETLYEKVRVHCEDLFAKELEDDERYGQAHLNAGCEIAANLLRKIAETGQHKGQFGGIELEMAAESIIKLHKKIKELEVKLNVWLPKRK